MDLVPKRIKFTVKKSFRHGSNRHWYSKIAHRLVFRRLAMSAAANNFEFNAASRSCLRQGGFVRRYFKVTAGITPVAAPGSPLESKGQY